MKVLITTDGSELAERAATQAARLLGTWTNQGAIEVHLLNVQPPVRGTVGMFVSRDDVQDYQRDEGFKAIGPTRAALEQAGFKCTPHIGVGSPGEVIDRYARDLGVDLICMGTRGLGNVADMVLGSTTEDVLRVSKVPVLLLK